jgi:hypothetical protein
MSLCAITKKKLIFGHYFILYYTLKVSNFKGVEGLFKEIVHIETEQRNR